jgi:hypothetical protein
MATKPLSRAVAHDASVVPGELALCCISESTLYADHNRAARYERDGSIAAAVSLYTDCAWRMSQRLQRRFPGDYSFTATDILAAAVELSIYYRQHLAESE